MVCEADTWNQNGPFTIAAGATLSFPVGRLLADQVGHWVLLWWYPKASTRG